MISGRCSCTPPCGPPRAGRRPRRLTDLVDKLLDLGPRLAQRLSAQRSDLVVLPNLAVHDARVAFQVTGSLEIVQQRVKGARRQLVAVAGQLLHEPDPVHRSLTGVVKNVDLDKPEKEVAQHLVVRAVRGVSALGQLDGSKAAFLSNRCKCSRSEQRPGRGATSSGCCRALPQWTRTSLSQYDSDAVARPGTARRRARNGDSTVRL